jgi:bifunctional non-homologous end joining protein LigD
MFPRLSPLPLSVRSTPFDHPDWIFEIKFDGFRSLVYIEDGACRMVSRKNHTYKSFPYLCEEFSRLKVANAVFDGEVVCLDEHGRSQFNKLLFRRGDPFFYVFDLL